MRSKVAFLPALLSVLIFPVTAWATGVYSFNFVGPHTITYSLPDDFIVANHKLFNFFGETAQTSFDGASGVDTTDFYYIAGPFDSGIILDTPESFGADRLFFPVGSYVTFEAVDPPAFPDLPPDRLRPVFIPGTYQLVSFPYPLDYHQQLGNYTLTITHETATVQTPEPSSFFLLTVGTLGLAYLSFTRRLPLRDAGQNAVKPRRT